MPAALFETVSPESLGIPSEGILRFLEKMRKKHELLDICPEKVFAFVEKCRRFASAA